ncbi:MAG TPA: TetR family transcriptional regulator C-terminal domain-containing protein, partial [Aggregatilineales bacterium]|nr:TetR family transcriptional regulator C-terminal domain-containing protein [Aggregatilineales bacterium]
ALQAFDYAYEQVSRQFMENLRDKSGAVERLLGAVEFFRLQAVDPPVPGGCPVLNTAIESDDSHPALRERARNAMNEWRELIQRIVQKGIEHSEITPKADPDTVASILISTLEGSVMLSRLYRDPVHMYRAVDHLTAYIQNELAMPSA